jgi:predicted AAA+ superfamily ATPase
VKAILKTIILENQNTDFPEIIPRAIHIPTDLEFIVSLIGARRSGKTYLLYQVIGELLQKGIEKEKILFLNFEDERLTFQKNDLDLILQAYTELFPESALQNTWFFLDEIQNIHGWEKFVRRIYDAKSKHIFITGSNSKLLSTEIATELRGRTITFTVYPLSLSEYLQFNKVDKKLYPQSNKSKIIHFTHRFMLHGGFPATVHLPEHLRTRILQEYFNVMIFRDIIERYTITNPEVLKFFIKKIFAGVTKPFSVNKTYNDLKSMGYKISNKYLYEYFEYCHAVFLCRTISKFDFSEIKQAKSDKKAYIIDNGLLSAVEFSITENKGKLFENMVANEFLKSGKELFYYRATQECDFIIREGDSVTAIQVSWELKNNDTRERELKGLYEACSYLNQNSGTIITFDEEEELDYKGIHVNVVPVYRYFLEQK